MKRKRSPMMGYICLEVMLSYTAPCVNKKGTTVGNVLSTLYVLFPSFRYYHLFVALCNVLHLMLADKS